MKGEVRQIGGLEGGGLILGEDGNRYSFLLHEWKADHVPVIGTPVEFVATDGIATQVHPHPAASPPVEIPAFEIPPSNASLFAGIGKLPGGSWLRIDSRGTIRESRYWDAWDHVTPLDRDTEAGARSLDLEHVAPLVDEDHPGGHRATTAKRSGESALSHSPVTRLSAIAAVAPGPQVTPWASCPQHR